MAVIATIVGLAVPFTGGPASAGSNSSSDCSTGQTICVTAVADEQSWCSESQGSLECTPRAVASASPSQPVRVPVVMGGKVTWTGVVECEYAVKNGSFSEWQACPGGGTRSQTRTLVWGSGPPIGGDIVHQWGPIVNLKDSSHECVLIHVTVQSSATARSETQPFTNTIETAQAGSSWSNIESICE